MHITFTTSVSLECRGGYLPLVLVSPLCDAEVRRSGVEDTHSQQGSRAER